MTAKVEPNFPDAWTHSNAKERGHAHHPEEDLALYR